MNYLAHRSEDGTREQTIYAHLTGTATLSEKFAAVFNAGEMGRFCGLAHDIGKYSNAFQQRILGSSVQVDHSTAGALEALAVRNVPAAFVVAGHHGGLPDMGNKTDTSQESTLFGKSKRKIGVEVEDYSAYKDDISLPSVRMPDRFGENNQNAFFFTRMLYSCLVDADFLDTEQFMSDGKILRGSYETLAELQKKLSIHIAPWLDAKGELNRKRTEILLTMTKGSAQQSGIFSLTVPTGGGKTVTSMAFALSHALKNGLERVIYVIPYTSIIEQTQAVFERIFGAENVVAHYAAVHCQVQDDEPQSSKKMLSTENWDAPIILTTAVQFFESLYASRSSQCRKLHNIARSVVIFDEAQMLPVPYLRPCISAISQLVKNYMCTAVLCTATQPSLDKLFSEMLNGCTIRELCPKPQEMYTFFRRVTYEKAGMLSDEELSARLNAEKQVLCIVNSRKQVQKVFSLLDLDGSCHLSTMMCPAHRRSLLEVIRLRLKDGMPCRVVSTSLVEAGVDLDFPTVYRSMAGLDSIIQAGGRCNREGRRLLNESIVHVFDTEQRPPQMILQNIAAAREIMENFEDFAAPEAISAYFEFLFYRLKNQKALDNKNILPEIESGTMAFESIANRFKIIESAQFNIYVPWEDGAVLTQKLLDYGANRSIFRELAQYTVGVYPQHFTELVNVGAVQMVSENTGILLDMNLYSNQTGLAFHVDEGKGIFI